MWLLLQLFLIHPTFTAFCCLCPDVWDMSLPSNYLIFSKNDTWTFIYYVPLWLKCGVMRFSNKVIWFSLTLLLLFLQCLKCFGIKLLSQYIVTLDASCLRWHRSHQSQILISEKLFFSWRSIITSRFTCKSGHALTISVPLPRIHLPVVFSSVFLPSLFSICNQSCFLIACEQHAVICEDHSKWQAGEKDSLCSTQWSPFSTHFNETTLGSSALVNPSHKEGNLFYFETNRWLSFDVHMHGFEKNLYLNL